MVSSTIVSSTYDPNLSVSDIAVDAKIEDEKQNVPQPTEYNTGEVIVKKGSGKPKVRKGQSEEAYFEQKSQFWSTGPLLNTENWLTDYFDKTYFGHEIDNEHIEKANQEANEQQELKIKIDSLSLEDKVLPESEIRPLSKMDKVQRDRTFRALERMYFTREYERCLNGCNILLTGTESFEVSSKEYKKIKRNIDEITEIRDSCLKKLSESLWNIKSTSTTHQYYNNDNYDYKIYWYSYEF